MTEALIRKAQKGDRQAFECLLESYYDTLYKFAYKWSNHKADAEDIAQLACIKLAKGIKQFRFEASFTSWLYRLVINCAKDWQKSQVRHQGQAEVEELPAEQLLPQTDQHEPPILLRQVLAQLDQGPEGMKETLLLVHGEGLTHAEAATVLGVKESTISWRIHEIRKTLKPWFGEAL